MPSKNKPSSAVAVQTTNDSSLLSKHSMVTAGYFSDPFIGEFVHKFSSSRTALINRGYYIRAKAVEYTISKWLLNCRENYSIPYQILSLGAGFDTLFFRLNLTDVKVFEVDYHDVISRKACIIKSSNTLTALLPSDAVFTQTKTDSVVLNSSRYALIGTDLKNLANVEKLLEQCHIDYEVPTLLLSECAITYMREVDSTKLIRWACDRFKNATFATYEQVSPMDGFGQVMVNHFQSTGSPLRSVETHPTLQLQQQRYLNAGWSSCEVIDMNAFYQTLSSNERLRVDQLELFEEYEEFHQKCSHYVLITASHQQQLQKTVATDSKELNVCDMAIDENVARIKRFGHRSVLLNNQLIVTVGGFGPSNDGHHKRLSNIDLMDKSGKNIALSSSINFLKSGLMYHSLTAVDSNTLLVFGGRTSPSTAFNDIYSIKFYDVNSDIDTRQPTIEKVVTVSNGPSPRWRHSATFISVNDKRKLFVFGGRTTTESAVSDCYCLDVDTMQWTLIQTSLDKISPPATHSHSSCCWSNNVIISGGLNSNSEPSNNIHVLDCATLQWNQIQAAGMHPRYSHTSHVWNEKLFLIAGVNTSLNAPGIGIVDLPSGQCVELSLPDFPQPVLLFKHSSILVTEEESILIFGGGGNCFSFGTHFNKLSLKIKLNELTY